MVSVTDFFKKSNDKKRKIQQPKVEAVINIDDESDDSLQEISPPKKARKVETDVEMLDAPKSEISEPVKVVETKAKKSPKKSPVKKPKEKSPPSTSTSTGGSVDSETILKSIPDAELPDQTEKLNFFQLQQRKQAAAGPSGSAEIPEAQPHCLSGLTMVFTGQLPSLERDQAESIAKRYGAKVTKSISGKTSVVVIGEEAGPSKVEKIKKLKIKAITEEGFLQLLASMPADGGDGATAKQAAQKRELEERKIIEEAEEEERLERQRAAKKKAEREAQLQAESSQASQSQSSGERLPREVPREITNDEKLWTVKYAPNQASQLCGNKTQVTRLRNWLDNWFENSKSGFKGNGGEGSMFRAALISGPPGIGKTSAAHLIAKECGYDILEKNASDVRSKTLLNTTMKSVLNNTSVVGFFQKRSHTNNEGDMYKEGNEKKFVLIMDEVDGMSSGDHGGAGALSQFCKITSMPMILICNDKSLPKMRTFDRVTYDLPFRRPSENEVKARIMTICHREKIKIDPSIIGQLVSTTNNDIRQMINLLSTVSKTQKTLGYEQSKDFSKAWAKQVVLKPFDITGKLLSGGIYVNPSHSLNDKIDLYFNDIDFTPLMVQENYLATVPRDKSRSHLEAVAQAADDISLSDHVNSLIRSSEQQWSLLPFHAVMSSVKPGFTVGGQITQRINFAGWLGQNSKQLKYQRILQELQYHTRLKTSTDKKELRLEYIPTLSKRLSQPFLANDDLGIAPVIDIMDEYYLTKEDWDNILDFGVGDSKGENIVKKIPTKVKSAFTRKYNSMTHPIAIYKTGNSVAGRGNSVKVDYEDVIEDDTRDEKEEKEEDNGKIDKNDKLIKEVKPKKKPVKRKKT
ncbi:replication factor C subunit 1 [[Candida] jaroonii]|uniref:Replication factor C subunit 1 n=1 Tax=[Candida] jaroonii TaxID=467808 RepID=A0ACA9Y6C7_9ASCO|nr:replication factor C subunit 1 [[Candida] jaroonii]